MTQAASHKAVVTLLAGLVATGCGERSNGGGEEHRFAARLGQVEKRLTRIEKQVESVEVLAARLRDLETRLAAAEARSARSPTEASLPRDQGPLATGDAGGASDRAKSWGSRPQGGDGEAARRRQADFLALAEEFRTKLAQLAEQYGEDESTPGRQEGKKALDQWYRTRVQEIMAQPDAPDARE